MTEKVPYSDLVVAFSGGKDSTALALRLAELGWTFGLLHTPTGNELPPVRKHIEAVAKRTGAELVIPPGPTLQELIDEQECLPNHRMRWCTRMIKIEPCAEWLRQHPDVKLAVGLRADEEGRVGGTYDGSIITYPLREWRWGKKQVIWYNKFKGFDPPPRTDCAWCYAQTLHEWFLLWRDWPEVFAAGERLENRIGHTFRTPSRDTWPASMAGLREAFEKGFVPKPRRRKGGCRICAL